MLKRTFRGAAAGLAFLVMCGRFILTTPLEALAEIFGFSERPNLAPRYNIAPTQNIPALRAENGGVKEGRAENGGAEKGGEVHLTQLHWGLVPFWAKEKSIAARMINARAETVAEKPAFRAAFRHRRCLIPADGFYEWKTAEDGGKQPYLIRRRDRAPFVFAGLWESWEDKESGEVLESCSIVTTDANETLSPIHHRMPVILDSSDGRFWMTAGSGEEKALKALLKPAPDEPFEAFPVSRAVNKVANDGPELLDPVGLKEDRLGDDGGKDAKPAGQKARAKTSQGELF